MSDGRIDIPNVNSPNFNEKVREALSVYLGNRGNPLDRGVTLRDLYDAGIISLTDGYLTNPSVNIPIAGVGSAVAAAGSSSGSSSGGSTYVVDLTPPPTPTGFTASAGLSQILIQHDSPTYTTGNGHSKSKLYGVKYVSGALPTFSETYLLAEFTGPIFSFPSDINAEWHFWLKWVSVDGVASTTPAGGVNGVMSKTGKVGNSDLTDLIVTAAKLADGSVDGSKLAVNAIAAGTAAIQDGAIVNAMIGDATIDSAKIASLSAAKITSGYMQVGTYIRSTSYAAGSTGWAINADGSAEFGANYIRGQLTASQIDARGLSIKDAAGNVILSAGSSLENSTFTFPGTVVNIPPALDNSSISGNTVFVLNTTGIDVDVEFRLNRTTGGSASITWNGSLLQMNKPFKPVEIGVNNISATAPASPFAGQVWIQP